jgi:hypothetical protein
MDLENRFLGRTLLAATLALAFLAAAPAAAAVVYIDGYVTAGPDVHCTLVKGHDGRVYALEGAGWQGVIANDHVRLAGRFVPERRCGVQSGFEVSDVQTIWTDDNHRSVYYDHARDGRFRDWARRHHERESAREHGDREHHEPPPR